MFCCLFFFSIGELILYILYSISLFFLFNFFITKNYLGGCWDVELPTLPLQTIRHNKMDIELTVVLENTA